ncbi:MAG: hypothetical protein NWF11_05160 [Candidatus Bathyarchaeota archaeon]|nr:hypothetical protein [Candidatus Bathyarchaeota archaeon]
MSIGTPKVVTEGEPFDIICKAESIGNSDDGDIDIFDIVVAASRYGESWYSRV